MEKLTWTGRSRTVAAPALRRKFPDGRLLWWALWVVSFCLGQAELESAAAAAELPVVVQAPANAPDAVPAPAPAAGDALPVSRPARFQAQRGVIIEFNTDINPLTQQYLYRQLTKAEALQADLVVIEIDSPGGTLIESEEIADKLRELSFAHTVAYIPRRALSGAAIFSLGSEEIVMHPEAIYGDAGAIFQVDGAFRFVEPKIRSELAARVRQVAEARDRPGALAEAMVDMDAEVFRVRHREDGRERWMTEAEIAGSSPADAWEKLFMVPETQKGRFFTCSGARAVELQVAEANVTSREALAARYGLAEPFTVLEWTRMDTAVTVLNHPLVTGLLFIIGLSALVVEFSIPGVGLGGLLGTICFVLFFWSRFLGGTGQWLDLVLFVCGLVLLLIELLILPGFGIWGVSGILLMVAGLILASHKFVIPTTSADFQALGQSTAILSLAMVTCIATVVLITWVTGRIPILDRFALEPPPPVAAASGANSGQLAERSPQNSQLAGADHAGAAGQGTVAAAASNVGDPTLGAIGRTAGPLRPAGIADFDGRRLEVVSDGLYVDTDQQVEVIRYQGRVPVVRPVSYASGEAGRPER